ncbi:polysaccharide export protein [Dyella soli]|uniref:Polysaccharide export protein n=1 Tax=Dyella soli TaxID=522319 RepID=A0A4R0YN39_9GAMM|nr:polysaccharide biosynthesis/export family protein [Dyella soli]TCI08957.1 polysaccharide export protein [Dyella soli]
MQVFSAVSRRCVVLALGAFVGLTGCSTLPANGPSRSDVEAASQKAPPSKIHVVQVDESVARQLASKRLGQQLASALPASHASNELLGAGDAVEVSIWEAPPALLFGDYVLASASNGTSATRPTTLPEQVVSSDGAIGVPFAGRVRVAGLTVAQAADAIAQKLAGKANHPQVIVRQARNASSYVTVVGEVTNSMRVPLTPHGERLLDALAVAGGVRQPVQKMTIQVARGGIVRSLPLEAIIKDPSQDIVLQPDDVVTAAYQPLSFVAMGATGRNAEINFEATGVSLAEALGRMGGLADSRSDPRGVFIFRFEDASALPPSTSQQNVTADGRVPVIYQIDLRNPQSLFIAQNFQVENKDIVYVANAPLAELQKFMSIVGAFTSPIVNVQTIQNTTTW